MTENLISRILSDANATADSIVSKATESAKNSIQQAQQRAMDLRQRAHVEMEEQRKKALESKATVAEIDAKKQVLMAKVECIDEVFALALKKLCDMDSNKQTEFVLRMIDKYATKGDVVVLAKGNKIDKQVLLGSKAFVERDLKMGDEGNFAGGLVLCGEKFDKRLTYEELLQEERSTLQGEIFARLIKDE